MPNVRESAINDWSDFVRYAAASDIGLRRTANQDAWTVVRAEDQRQWRRHGHLFVVADGMGAHAAGELASRLAIETVPKAYRELESLGPADALRRAMVEANALIHARGLSRVDWLGMGTTCSALTLVEQGAIVAHVGDSRVYRVRGELIEQLTFDHSLVWELMEIGQIPKNQVPPSIPKNVITRSIGPSASVDVDLEGPYPVQPADRYLLCSDGLTGLVEDHEIGQMLVALPIGEAVDTLIDLANLRGGPDNITVVAVEVIAAPPETISAVTVEAIPRQRADPSEKTHHSPAMLRRAAREVARLFGRSRSVTGRADRPQYGNGPYRTATCSPARPLVETLADTADKLRQVLAECGLPPDPPGHEETMERAKAASARGAPTEAIQHYSRLIQALFTQLRDHGDGMVDLSLVD